MPRQVRVEYEGAFYHVMARGNRRAPIFAGSEGADEELFLTTLDRCCDRTGFRVWAWVLMGNHYHLLIETPRANLVEGMSWLQNTYTRRFNARHREWGRLFGDRYKSVLIEPEDGGLYLGSLMDYIQIDPSKNECLPDGKGYRSGSQAKDHAKRDAEGIIEEAVRHFKMSGGGPDDFARLPRGDKRLVAVAWALARQTSLKQLWIVERLSMRTADNVSTQVRNLQSEDEKQLPKSVLR